MDFIGERGYSRQVVRGHSTCFECLDQRDIVLQAVSKPKSDAVEVSDTGCCFCFCLHTFFYRVEFDFNTNLSAHHFGRVSGVCSTDWQRRRSGYRGNTWVAH